METTQTDIAVIGAGLAATGRVLCRCFGKSYSDRTGKAPCGVCLNRGCIPLKPFFILPNSSLNHGERKCGVTFAKPVIHLDQIARLERVCS